MKKYLLFLIIVLTVFGYFWMKDAKATQTDNVWGWAWSENVGWISFNCYNDYDGDGTLESHCTDMGYSSDYGVSINETTGNLSGYAWAGGGEDAAGNPVPTIGWINFDPAGAYPDTPNYSACLDLPDQSGESCNGVGDNTISGWARACAVFQSGCSGSLKPDSERGGWDGWIHLRDDGTIPYGVYIQKVNDHSEFHDWAWGGDDTSKTAIIGWVSFNCANEGGCGTSDYKVETSVVPNNPPTADFSCDPTVCNSPVCTGYNDCGTVIKNDSSDPDAGDVLTSTWYVKTNGTWEQKGTPCLDPPGPCDFTPATYLSLPGYESSYYVGIKLEVTDGKVTVIKSELNYYEHKRGAYAAFRCSATTTDWSEDCRDAPVRAGTVIYFQNNLWQAQNIHLDNSSYPSHGSATSSITWKLNGIQFGGNNSLASTTIVNPSNKIYLEVIDKVGKSDEAIGTIDSKVSPPSWREVSP